MAARRVSILGSTGSIGRNALDVVRRNPGLFKVVGLAAHANADLLAEQIAEFRPVYAALADEDAAGRLNSRGLDVTLWSGPEALERLAAVPVDVLLCAVVGSAGLKPLLSGIEAGNRIALANKESLVMAGEHVMERARARGVTILPVDSEHSAIFQCLQGRDPQHVRSIYLTASGGPFYGRTKAELVRVGVEEATHHPTWAMGAKISVDSATLMNKGLEVIEAMALFDVPLSKVEVIVHPQSVVHGLVEFHDGGLLGHLGVADMRLPILFALAWPERVQSPVGRLDLAAIGALTFAAPDFDAFPCLALALHAARLGGTAPAVLNAANEVAVEAFCSRRIEFLSISDVVRGTLDEVPTASGNSIDAVLAADEAARCAARSIVETIGMDV